MASEDNLIGKTLGQYEIIEEIGRGGMATVYSARQKSMNRTVAVKVLPPHLLHDPNFYERFEREVDVIAHLEHPHILPIYDYGQSDGVPFIAMRYLGGGSLEQFIRRGTSNLDDLERPLRQICQALDYAHKEGVIHRDIKPGNIMLDTDGNAYLSDFGIARVLGSELTGSMIVGTPAYMSPEQANGLPIDGRADIYALGVVLFELITGREPYQAETPMAVLIKHISEPMPSISQFRENVPKPVQDVVAKATLKDPDDRFASAGELAKAYSGALRGETANFDMPTSSGTPSQPDTASLDHTKTFTGQMPDHPTIPPTGNMTPSPSGQFDASTGGFDTTTQAQKGPSNNVLITVVIVVALIVIGGIAALVLLDQDDSEPIIEPQTAFSAVPTPFFRAETVRDELYTISIPEQWIPPMGFFDLSEDDRMIHVWQPDQQGNRLNAYVSLEIIEDDLTTTEAFEDAVERYTTNALDTREDSLTEIDSAVAEDGTIRRSFRMVGARDGNVQFPPGQLDVFILNRAPYLVALHVYSADETGNTLVQTFQSILDSLRIDSTS